MRLKPIDKKDKKKGLIVTILVHLGVVAFILYLASFPVPDPAFPEEKLSLTLDFSKGGAYAEQSTVAQTKTPVSSSVQPKEQAQSTSVSKVKESSITQEKSIKQPKKANKNVQKTKEKTTPTKKPKYNFNNAFKQSSNSPKSNTNSTQSNAQNQSGDGPLSGNGNGGGGGKNRLIQSAPELKNPTQETGDVMVELTLDSQGNVVESRYLAKHPKTTTSNITLLKYAVQQAKKIKFSPSDKSTEKIVKRIHFTVE